MLMRGLKVESLDGFRMGAGHPKDHMIRGLALAAPHLTSGEERQAGGWVLYRLWNSVIWGASRVLSTLMGWQRGTTEAPRPQGPIPFPVHLFHLAVPELYPV